MKEATEAKRILLKKLGKPAWLVGVGIAKKDDEYAVKVIGRLDSPPPVKVLPRKVNGVHVVYEHSGPVKKLPK